MQVLHEQTRRLRYSPQSESPRAAITAQKVRLLQFVADYGILSLPQIARLGCPSEKSARRHIRDLFDGGLVRVIAVPRAALGPSGRAEDLSLMFGSAPNLYTVTRSGQQFLWNHELVNELKPVPEYGPRNSLFLAHELAIRDVRIWLELSARSNSKHDLTAWHDGDAGQFDLKRTGAPTVVRSDAWFTYCVHDRVLVGLVEVDRGTERGLKRWGEKLLAYRELFIGDRLHEMTGYRNARVLVFTPNARRRDRLAEIIRAHASEPLAARFWLVDDTFPKTDFDAAVWRTTRDHVLQPLLTSPHEDRAGQ
jgi:hypothetical protein